MTIQDITFRRAAGLVQMLLALVMFFSVLSFGENDYRYLVSGNPVNNMLGPFGAWISHLLRSCFGIAAYLVPAIFAYSGWSLLSISPSGSSLRKTTALVIFLLCLSPMLSLLLIFSPQLSGGYFGYYCLHALKAPFGVSASYMITGFIFLTSLVFLGIIFFAEIFRSILFGLQSNVTLVYEDDPYPLNSLEDAISNKKPHYPWIIKKKVLIYGPDEIPEGLTHDPVKLIGMSSPLYSIDREPVQEYRDRMYAAALPQNVLIISENKTEELAFCFDGGKKNHELVPVLNVEKIVPFEDLHDREVFHEEPPVNHDAILPENTEDDFCHDETPAVEAGPENRPEDSSDEDHDDADPLPGKVFEEILINKEYIIPQSFLNCTVPRSSEDWNNEIKRNSQLLVNTLAEFGIESRVVNVNRGPVITLYELQIAPGIKVARITSLADDLAMALAAYRVRIIAPIPGKSAIGVEIPNGERENVTFGDIIKTEEFRSYPALLKVGLGKDILGKPVMLDLKKLPHLLIAGATGSGKSVCVNSIIASLIYNYDPNQVRFILIDPKIVELQLYNGMPHLLTPVITEHHVAPVALKWALYEMERRYRLLSGLNARDIEKYNSHAKKNGNCEILPYIVIIIDELADLMIANMKEMEGHITRIAQKARAVGIHLVLATQRPSVDIITGIIKANFPARIAFQVPQKIDSRTIIDQNGAEKLLGKGDMLYQSPTSSYPIRIQGAFISEEETMRIVEHLTKMGRPDYIDIEACAFEAEGDDKNGYDEEDDALFVEALKIVDETRKASASYLQRRLSIGYNRAARIIDLMEERGYIGPQQGSKPREVLI